MRSLCLLLQLVTEKLGLTSLIRWSEVGPVTTFKGDLQIGKDLRIKVKTL